MMWRSKVLRAATILAVAGALLLPGGGDASAGISQDKVGEPRQAVASQPASAPATSQPTSAPAARMELSPKEMDFGEVWQGVRVEREFTVKNVGSAPLTITARADCACTVVDKPKSPLSPGESSTFSVSYDSKRIGEARKSIRMDTSDPDKPEVVIPVRGTVKRLFAFTPDPNVDFKDLDVSSAETRVLKLESQYDRPLKLRLKEGEAYGVFEVSLKEMKRGQEYQLTVMTRPPLAQGWNRTQVTLVLDAEELAPLTVYVNAQVRAPVDISPTSLVVAPNWRPGAQRELQVSYQAESPLKITDIKCDIPGVKWELAGAPSQVAGQKRAVWQIRVTLPAIAQVPGAGGAIEVFTDHPDKDYQRFSVPIKRAAAKPESKR